MVLGPHGLQVDSHDLSRSLRRLQDQGASGTSCKGLAHYRLGNHNVLCQCPHGKLSHRKTHYLKGTMSASTLNPGGAWGIEAILPPIL